MCNILRGTISSGLSVWVFWGVSIWGVSILRETISSGLSVWVFWGVSIWGVSILRETISSGLSVWVSPRFLETGSKDFPVFHLLSYLSESPSSFSYPSLFLFRDPHSLPPQHPKWSWKNCRFDFFWTIEQFPEKTAVCKLQRGCFHPFYIFHQRISFPYFNYHKSVLILTFTLGQSHYQHDAKSLRCKKFKFLTKLHFDLKFATCIKFGKNITLERK